MINIYDDINIIIDRGNALGFGYVNHNGEQFVSNMYQENIPEQMGDDESILEHLAQGKAYGRNSDDVLDSINEVLGFWFLGPISLPLMELPTFSSIEEASKELLKSRGTDSETKFLLYQDK